MNSPDLREHFRLLIVDDLATIHEDFRKILEPATSPAALHATAAALFDDPAPTAAPLARFTVDSAFQGAEALGLVEKAVAAGQPYALAFVDVRMPPGWDGLETIRRLWTVDPELQVVLCTAYSDYTWTETVRSLGLNSNLIILKKPFDNTEVLQMAHALARKWQLARENANRLAELDELVRQRTSELRRAQEAFTQAFAANPHAQSVVALEDGTILAVNEAFEIALGRPAKSFIGLNLAEFGCGLDPAKFEKLRAELLAGNPVQNHAFVLRLEGRQPRNIRCFARPVTISGRRCAIWVFEDFTEYLHLETQYRQAQKMEAVGQLAAGVAHDFNNLLTVIQCYTTELLGKPANASLRPLLEPIHTAALRAATLTRQLLVFSRKQIAQFEELDVAAVLSGMRPFLNRLIGEHVNLVWSFPDSLPSIQGDAAAVEQIVVNLVVNARDAVARGGTVKLNVTVCDFATAAEARHAQGAAGRYIALQIADNGSGIPPEVLPRIFEPFFTTKGVGKGTGLGLSTVYSLARQHQGWIDVQTAVGEGTTFTVFLPVAQRVGENDGELPAEQHTPDTLPKIRILAVEDDVAIQTMLKALFERYQVPCAVVRDASWALSEWHCAGPFDLVITDVVMPGKISGVELARQLRALSPGLPIVFITGYSAEHVADEKIDIPGPAPRIALKPFTVASLTEAIVEVLKTARPTN